MAVVHPLRVGVYCSPSRARLAIVIVVLAAVGYNFIRFWEYWLTTRFDNQTGVSRLISIPWLRANPDYWLW